MPEIKLKSEKVRVRFYDAFEHDPFERKILCVRCGTMNHPKEDICPSFTCEIWLGLSHLTCIPILKSRPVKKKIDYFNCLTNFEPSNGNIESTGQFESSESDPDSDSKDENSTISYFKKSLISQIFFFFRNVL